MTWTTPRTWVTGELVTSTIMNAHVRDNLDALKAPPTEHYEANEGSDYTTTSTSLVDVDSTNLALSLTTYGGDVVISFHGMIKRSAAGFVFLDVEIDDGDTPVMAGGDDGIVGSGVATTPVCIGFTRLITGLAAGSYVFSLQWRNGGAGTATLYAGAGTTNGDVHPQFWVREVS